MQISTQPSHGFEKSILARKGSSITQIYLYIIMIVTLSLKENLWDRIYKKHKHNEFEFSESNNYKKEVITNFLLLFCQKSKEIYEKSIVLLCFTS